MLFISAQYQMAYVFNLGSKGSAATAPRTPLICRRILKAKLANSSLLVYRASSVGQVKCGRGVVLATLLYLRTVRLKAV